MSNIKKSKSYGLIATPLKDCSLCPRLYHFRQDNQLAYPEWFNGAVPSFGDPKARLLIVGLAPGLKGANKTGRPFTGDYAGDLLYDCLTAFDFTRGQYRPDGRDDFQLQDCMITNAVRCVPPQNKPISSEINMCRQFLIKKFSELEHLKVIIALGRIAHESVLKSFEVKLKAAPFAHGAIHILNDLKLDRALILIDSYHCSRYNTNTGRLTRPMFESVFDKARDQLVH